MSVLANTTVITNFARIGELDLLRQLYTTLFISTQVYEEIQAGLDEGYQFFQGIEQNIFPLMPSGWIHLTSLTDAEELHLFGQLPSRLHRGEASCLAIARQRDWLFLTDDQAARREAIRLGIRLSSSIGCLVLAVERSLVTLEQGNTSLANMIRQGARSPVTDLRPLIKQG